MGLRHEFAQVLLSRFGIQVQTDAGFVAVEAGEVAGPDAARDLAAARFDLSDLGAEIGEQHGGIRTGQHGADFEDPDPRQRSAVFPRHRNSVASAAIISRGRRLEAPSSSRLSPIGRSRTDRSVTPASANRRNRARIASSSPAAQMSPTSLASPYPSSR